MTLHAHNITAMRGRSTVLHDVDVAIEPGRITAVIGENGAGKSTLVDVLVGELRPTRGHVGVVVDDREFDLATLSVAARARLWAVLPQRTHVVFDLDVLDVVLIGRAPWHVGRPRDLDADVALRCLEQVDARHLATRSFLQLSGGEQQRVALARALAQLHGEDGRFETGARSLILDEPTTYLDFRAQELLMHVARAAADGGKGVLVVVHDLNLAAALADHVVVLSKGRVVSSGAPADVMTGAILSRALRAPVKVAAVVDGRPLLMLDRSGSLL
ncbi:MAG TPA: ATP-binding cassette domain-containing protein [Myxococcota bacterium]